MQVKTVVIDGRLRLFSEYSAELIRRVRAIGGKWKVTYWEFPVESGSKLVEKLFGSSEEVVRVRVGKASEGVAGWEESDNFVMLGGYVLCSRRNRDDSPHWTEDMVAGSAPAYGGSVKNPRVYLTDDAEFELEVRKDFAETHKLTILECMNATETHPEQEAGPTDQEVLAVLQKLMQVVNLSYEWMMQGEDSELAYDARQHGEKFMERLKKKIGEKISSACSNASV